MTLTRTLVALSGAALLTLSSAAAAGAQEETDPPADEGTVAEEGTVPAGSLGSLFGSAQDQGDDGEGDDPADGGEGEDGEGGDDAGSGSLGSLFGPDAFAGSNYGSFINDPTQTGSVAEWLLDWSQGSTITSDPEEDTDPEGAPVVFGSLQAGSLNLQGSADAGLAELGSIGEALPGGSLDTGSLADVVETESLDAIDNVDLGTLFGS